jgi:hypothetical protein
MASQNDADGAGTAEDMQMQYPNYDQDVGESKSGKAAKQCYPNDGHDSVFLTLETLIVYIYFNMHIYRQPHLHPFC